MAYNYGMRRRAEAEAEAEAEGRWRSAAYREAELVEGLLDGRLLRRVVDRVFEAVQVLRRGGGEDRCAPGYPVAGWPVGGLVVCRWCAGGGGGGRTCSCRMARVLCVPRTDLRA